MGGRYLSGCLEGTDLVEWDKRNTFSELALAEQLSTDLLIVDNDIVEATACSNLERH